MADSRCLPCHSKQVESYARTGMGRSISKPSKMVHKMAAGTYPLAWAVGSGNQGTSYLIAIKDALFQSPLSWYTERGAWDLSPGFEKDARPDFFRPVTPDCLFCHSGNVRPRAGTLNRYLDPPFEPAAIDCDRCHGDPAAHLAAPGKKTIVNPSRLEQRPAGCGLRTVPPFGRGSDSESGEGVHGLSSGHADGGCVSACM